jgi:archaellum component FlaC
MSNTTTWILDLQDKISEPIRKVQSLFADTMSSVKKATQGATATQKELEAKIKGVQSQLDVAKVKMTNSFSPKQVKEATVEVQRLEKELHDIATMPIGKGMADALAPARSTIGGIGRMLGGLFVADRAIQFGKSIVQVTGEFERYQAMLTHTFGSQQKATESMQMLQDFATSTPFQLDQLTASYVKLVNRGFEPTQSQMTKLGDLASATGKSFDQLAEAVLDAETNQFERLNEFGIKASKNGEQITLKFKDAEKTIANTPSAIREALVSFGELKGVAGSSAVQMATIPGIISNMQDSWKEFKTNLGQAAMPAIKSIFDNIKKVIDLLANNVPTIIDAFTSIAIGAGIAGVSLAILNLKTFMLKIGTFSLTGALKALWGTMLANPFIAITAGIGAVVFAIIKLWKHSEGFRKFVYGLWGAIKATFSAMWSVVKNFFGGIGDMIESLLNRDFKGIVAGAKRTGDAMAQALNPAYFAMQNKDNIIAKYNEESKKGIKKQDKEAGASLPTEANKASSPLATLPTGKSTGSGSSASDGSGSGSQIRNVKTTINHLVGNITINTTTLKEGLGSIKSQITEALVSAVRDSEIAVAQ